MARDNFGVEKALRIYATDSDTTFIDILFGSAAPGGDAGEQDAASLGSVYFRQDGATSKMYQKTAATNAVSDWTENAADAGITIDELSWRNETVRAATNDTVAAGTVDPTGFSDNESGLDGNDFSVGEYLLGNVDSGVPLLFEVTVVTGAADITVAAAGQALASNDTFIVQSYLPDSGASQEGQAIIHFPSASAPGIKIADVNWNLADGIGMAAGYAAANGSVSSADTVNSAIEKLDGNQQDILTANGISQGDINYGTFTEDLLADNQVGKDLFQRLETLLTELHGDQVTGITTIQTVDSVPIASVRACKWLVEVSEDATPANRKCYEIYALNDGVSANDHTVYAKLKVGSNFNDSVNIQVAGGNMNLRIGSSSAGITATFRKIEILKNTLS